MRGTIEVSLLMANSENPREHVDCDQHNNVLQTVEGLNVINDPKCNKVLNVITFCPKCNKVVNVIKS